MYPEEKKSFREDSLSSSTGLMASTGGNERSKSKCGYFTLALVILIYAVGVTVFSLSRCSNLLKNTTTTITTTTTTKNLQNIQKSPEALLHQFIYPQPSYYPICQPTNFSILTLNGRGCQVYATRKNRKFTFWHLQANVGDSFSVNIYRGVITILKSAYYNIVVNVLIDNHDPNATRLPSFQLRKYVMKSNSIIAGLGYPATKILNSVVGTSQYCKQVCTLTMNAIVPLKITDRIFIAAYNNGMRIRTCPKDTNFAIFSIPI